MVDNREEEEENIMEKNPFINYDEDENLDDNDNNQKATAGNEFIDFSYLPKEIKEFLEKLDGKFTDIELELNDQREKYKEIKKFFNNVNLNEKDKAIEDIIKDIVDIVNKVNDIKLRTKNLNNT